MKLTRIDRGMASAIALFAFMSIGAVSSAFASDYTPLVGRSNSSFNTIYSPDPSAAGSVLSIDATAKEVLLVSSQGQSNNLRWRTFLPPGTKVFEAALFTFSNAVETKVAGRFGVVPVSFSEQVTQQASDSFLRSEALSKLLAGSELLYFSPLVTFADGTQAGSGTTRLSARQEDTSTQVVSTKGGWVYFNTLQAPGNFIKNIDVRVTVDEACYRNWFANAQFDLSGNPREDVDHTCSGSSGTPIVALTQIVLSGASLTKDTSNTINITPLPSGATLPTCTATDASGVTSTQVNISGGTISLNPSAASISANQTVIIRCGQTTASLTIVPAAVAAPLTGISLSVSSVMNSSTEPVTISALPIGAVLPACTAPLPPFNIPNPYVKVEGSKITLTANGMAVTEKKTVDIDCGGFKASFTVDVPLSVIESVESDGSLTLKFKLQPASTEIGKATKVWVAARLPATSSFVTTDTWFFRTPSTWQTLVLPNLDLLVFKTFTAVTASEDIVLPTGLPKDLMQYYALEIYFGYQTTAGQFKNIGRIWK